MTNISININDQLLKKMKTFYHDYIVTSNNKYALFIAKIDGCTITAYTSKKVLFQGKNAEAEASIWTSIKQSTIEKKCDANQYYHPSIGSDEVGTGDYFGPVIVVSTYLDIKHQELIKNLKIDDSKKLTDQDILLIAPKLFKILPYSLLIVNNEKYNEVMSKGDMNLNKLKAVLHKQAINNLLNKINCRPKIIIDQFCSIDNFNKYISDHTFSKQVDFYTKAESKYASVACASMMARYTFLKEFDKLSKQYGVNLQKGASNKVDEQGLKLVNQFGSDVLMKIAKVHFKNTDKINMLFKNAK